MISKHVKPYLLFGLISFLKLHNSNLSYDEKLYYNLNTYKFVKAVHYDSFHYDYDVIRGDKECSDEDKHKVDAYLEKKGPLYISFDCFLIGNIENILDIESKIKNVNSKCVSWDKFNDDFMSENIVVDYYSKIDDQVVLSIKNDQNKFDHFLKNLKRIKACSSYVNREKSNVNFCLNIVTERTITNSDQFDYKHIIGNCTFVMKKNNTSNMFKKGNKYFGLTFTREMWEQIVEELDNIFKGAKYTIKESEFKILQKKRKESKVEFFTRRKS